VAQGRFGQIRRAVSPAGAAGAEDQGDLCFHVIAQQRWSRQSAKSGEAAFSASASRDTCCSSAAPGQLLRLRSILGPFEETHIQDQNAIPPHTAEI